MENISSESSHVVREMAMRDLRRGKYDEAINKFRELAQRGDRGDRIFFASLFVWWAWIHEGSERWADPDETLRWLMDDAENEDSKAQYFVALAMEAKDDYERSVEWLRRSASHEFAPAEVRIGLLYSSGKIFEQDLDKAFINFKKAFLSGHLFGERFYGSLLMKGKGNGCKDRIRGTWIYLRSFPKSIRFAFKDPYSEDFMM